MTLGPGVTVGVGGQAERLIDMVHNPADWTVSPHNSGRLDSENAFHDCLHSLYVTVDLLQNSPITGVTVWHFHGDPRQYCNQKIALSTTGAFAGEEDVVYETGPEYGPPESIEGIPRTFPPTEARYVRHWCGRSTANTGVHFLEMDVYGGGLSSGAAARESLLLLP